MAKIDSKPSRLLVPSDSNPSKLTKVIFFLIPKLICRAHHQIVLLIGHFSSSTVSRTLQVLLCSGYFTGTFDYKLMLALAHVNVVCVTLIYLVVRVGTIFFLHHLTVVICRIDEIQQTNIVPVRYKWLELF